MKLDNWVLLEHISGYEKFSRYAISRTGAIKTCFENGTEKVRTYENRALKAGHICVNLRDQPGHWSDVRLAWLVATAFICPRPSLAHRICYRDGNPRNCSIENLAWEVEEGGANFQPTVIIQDAEWRPVTGFSGYRINDRGQVVRSNSGRARDVLLKSFEHHGTRRYVALRRDDKRSITIPLAKLVADHFLPIVPSAAHFLWYKDGEFANCSAANLYWTERAYLDYLPMHDSVTNEDWRICIAHPDYQISSAGRVRRGAVNCAQNPGYNSKANPEDLLIKTRVHARGNHLSVTLNHRHSHTSLMLHRLVCETFHGPAPTLDHFVWFLDGDLQNCRAMNLRWITSQEAARTLDEQRPPESEWRTIPNYDENEVNALGQVRRKRFLQSAHQERRIMKPSLNSEGKAVISITHRGNMIHMLIHSLVAAAFLPPPPEEYAYVRHKDGNPLNCMVENLEWTTHRTEFTRRYRARLAAREVE